MQAAGGQRQQAQQQQQQQYYGGSYGYYYQQQFELQKRYNEYLNSLISTGARDSLIIKLHNGKCFARQCRFLLVTHLWLFFDSADNYEQTLKRHSGRFRLFKSFANMFVF